MKLIRIRDWKEDTKNKGNNKGLEDTKNKGYTNWSRAPAASPMI